MTEKWLNQILEQHHREAFMWARQCCNYDYDQAKEILQLVYVKILEGKAKYDEKANLKTWIFSVIRFTAIDYQRSQLIFEDLGTIENVIEDEPETVETFDYKELIMKLPAGQRQVLLLVFYHNMTLKEAAVILTLSIGTVRTHYDRGKSALKKLILNTGIYG
ncbi:RNA polymerase sigma factor [Fulvivirga sp.]|uniref:RNA polymerase sigma factor n=1 Tax=Fulvivirga sp. TaxID=1931237 RepID=UPI0032EF2B96